MAENSDAKQTSDLIYPKANNTKLSSPVQGCSEGIVQPINFARLLFELEKIFDSGYVFVGDGEVEGGSAVVILPVQDTRRMILQ